MIAALAGGVGAARLLRGLIRVVDPSTLRVIANTGDDTLNGDAGNDVVRGGQQNDVLDGGVGKRKYDKEEIGLPVMANMATSLNGTSAIGSNGTAAQPVSKEQDEQKPETIG